MGEGGEMWGVGMKVCEELKEEEEVEGCEKEEEVRKRQ